MPLNQTSWKAGQKVEGSGRPAGGRNRRTTEIVQKLIALGHKDPLETLSELQNSATDEGIRATAANMLAPFLHSKMGAIPIPPDPTFMEVKLKNPDPVSIDQCVENINTLTKAKAAGECSIEHADSLIADQKVILYAMLDQRKQDTAEGGSPDQVIRIEGGLPLLPGTNIDMPPAASAMNGHAVDGPPAEDHPQPPTPDT